MELFRKKKIYEHNIMEKIKINLDLIELTDLSSEDYSEFKKTEHRSLIGETTQYEFYRYFSGGSSDSYILRRDKKNQKVVFFGYAYQYICVYKDHILGLNHNGEIGRNSLAVINCQTGIKKNYNLLSPNAAFVAPLGYGRFYCQDYVNNVTVKGDEVVFDISRKKVDLDNTAKYGTVNRTIINKDIDYKLIIYMTDNTFAFESVDFSIIEKPIGKLVPHPRRHSFSEIYRPKNETAKTISDEKKDNQSKPTDVSSGLKKVIEANRPYWRNENDIISCPGDDCSISECDDTCPIWNNTIAQALFKINNYEKAIVELKRAVVTAPDFKDAWVNLGACYGLLGEYKEALDAYKKAFEIDNNYKNAIFGLGICNKDLGNYEESLRWCTLYKEKFSDGGLDATETDVLNRLKAKDTSKKKPESSVNDNNQKVLSAEHADTNHDSKVHSATDLDNPSVSEQTISQETLAESFIDKNTSKSNSVVTAKTEMFDSIRQIRFCRKCGTKAEQGSLFCRKCGTKL